MIEGSPEATRPGPRPFLQIPHLWLKLFNMGESFFRAEIGFASGRNTVLGLICLIIIKLILSGVQSLIISTQNLDNGDPLRINGMSNFSSQICLNLFALPLFFLITNGVLHVSAKLFGGKGKFSTFAYLVSLFFVPLYIISNFIGLLGIISRISFYITTLISLVVGIYQFILSIRCIKVVHDFTTMKATLAVLLPFVFLLIPICLISILSLLGPSIGSVFSGITNSVMTPSP
jgi:hypothetical protein